MLLSSGFNVVCRFASWWSFQFHVITPHSRFFHSPSRLNIWPVFRQTLCSLQFSVLYCIVLLSCCLMHVYTDSWWRNYLTFGSAVSSDRITIQRTLLVVSTVLPISTRRHSSTSWSTHWTTRSTHRGHHCHMNSPHLIMTSRLTSGHFIGRSQWLLVVSYWV